MPLPLAMETTAPHVISVALAERSYDIVAGAGLLGSAGETIAAACCGRPQADSRTALVVTDQPVGELYADKLMQSIAVAGFSPALVTLRGGETQKTLATVETIYKRLHELAADRRTIVIALGGGVVGDMAGFAAASYQRGLDFAQIPTTLLAQVDSSVGGKVGVNYSTAKNLIGAFHQPRLVLIDTETLQTLSLEERRSGMAEVIKYGAIADAALFERLQSGVKAILALQSDLLTDAIVRSCEIKARIVEQDERETTGARATLNFGHTVGHALEAATRYSRYRHGEAIAIGMITACLIGEEVGVTAPAVTAALLALCLDAGYEAAPDAGISDGAITALLALDKKSIGGAARFVLLEEIGVASSGHSVPMDAVRAALQRQRALKTG